MNMQKIIIASIIAVLLLALIGLNGCTEVRSFSTDERLLGAWKNTILKTEIIMFFPDGTWISMGSDGTWTTDDDKLIISIHNPKVKIDYEYDYSLSVNEKLILIKSNGLKKEYIKQ
jgi:hypothetical protein